MFPVELCRGIAACGVSGLVKGCDAPGREVMRLDTHSLIVDLCFAKRQTGQDVVIELPDNLHTSYKQSLDIQLVSRYSKKCNEQNNWAEAINVIALLFSSFTMSIEIFFNITSSDGSYCFKYHQK